MFHFMRVKFKSSRIFRLLFVAYSQLLSERINVIFLKICVHLMQNGLKGTFVYTINACHLDVTNDVIFICMYSNWYQWKSNKMWCTEMKQLIRDRTVFSNGVKLVCQQIWSLAHIDNLSCRSMDIFLQTAQIWLCYFPFCSVFTL